MVRPGEVVIIPSGLKFKVTVLDLEIDSMTYLCVTGQPSGWAF